MEAEFERSNPNFMTSANRFATLRLRGFAIAGLAICYFALGKSGLSLAVVHPSATAIWPSSGLALAAVILLGSWVWPGVFLGAFAVNLTTTGSLATVFGIALGNTL